MGFFVLETSPFDALRLQRLFNNHPLFSFLENLLVKAAGHSDEWLLRLLPITCGAASVGVLVWAVHRAWGLGAALAAGIYTATNPLFVEYSRDVRGYSLMVLAAIVSTLLLLACLRSETPKARAAYALVASIGMFTHLFMAPVIISHGVEVLRRRRVDRRWVLTFAGIALLSVGFYAPMLSDLVESTATLVEVSGDGEARVEFPLALSREVLGGQAITAVVAGVLVAIGIFRMRRSALALPFAGTALVVAGTGWLLTPENLAPRLFLWLVPAAAVAVAAVARTTPRVTAIGVGIVALVSVVGLADGYTESTRADEQIAAVVDRAAAMGATTCITDLSIPPMVAYTSSFEPLVDVESIDRCDVVAVAEPSLDGEYVTAAERRFDHRLEFRSGVVFARRSDLLETNQSD